MTLTVNELCPSDTQYPVLVMFGLRPLTESDDDGDCEGQVDSDIEIISSGVSATLSVPADAVSLRGDEEYCYTVRIIDYTGKGYNTNEFPLLPLLNWARKRCSRDHVRL